jgi:hypothetical protein
MTKKLSEYIKELQAIEAKEGNIEVWHSTDDKGNLYWTDDEENLYCPIHSSPEVRLAQKEDSGCVECLYKSEEEYIDELEEDISTSKKVVLL